MNITITGGAGFIGSHIAEQLSKKHKVKIIDNFRTGKIENLKGLKLEVIRGDIRDLNFKPDFTFEEGLKETLNYYNKLPIIN